MKRNGIGQMRIAAIKVERIRVRIGCRAARLPYRVKRYRTGCLESSLGGSIELQHVSFESPPKCRKDENLPPNGIQGHPEHCDAIVIDLRGQCPDNGCFGSYFERS